MTTGIYLALSVAIATLFAFLACLSVYAQRRYGNGFWYAALGVACCCLGGLIGIGFCLILGNLALSSTIASASIGIIVGLALAYTSTSTSKGARHATTP